MEKSKQHIEALDALLGGTPEKQPHADFTAQVMQKVERLQALQKKRRLYKLLLIALSALAAILLAAIVLPSLGYSLAPAIAPLLKIREELSESFSSLDFGSVPVAIAAGFLALLLLLFTNLLLMRRHMLKFLQNFSD